MRVVKLYFLYFLVIAAFAGVAGALSPTSVPVSRSSSPPSCQERLDKLERELVLIEIYCSIVEATCRGESTSDWSLPVSQF